MSREYLRGIKAAHEAALRSIHETLRHDEGDEVDELLYCINTRIDTLVKEAKTK